MTTKLLPMLNRVLLTRLLGAWAAWKLVSGIPETPEELEQFMEDKKRKTESINEWLMKYVGKPINDAIGFDLVRAQEDYENSPAHRWITGVTEDAGKTPLEMEMAHQIRMSDFQGKAKDDFDMGRMFIQKDSHIQLKKNLDTLSNIQNDFFKLDKNITSETPETINKNNQTLLNDRTGKSPNVLQYNDNRTYNTQTRTGGSSGGATGNVPVSTTPPASSWTKRESIIRPH